MKYISLFLLVFPSLLFAQEFNYFQGLPDDGFSELGSASNAFQQHMLKTIDYSANDNTPGFIRKSVRNIRAYDQETGVHRIVIATSRRWIDGFLRETENQLDFALLANNMGFFMIRLPSGTLAFTRDGRFRVDEYNRLVTLAGGYTVEGEGGEIIVPPYKDVAVSRSGVLFFDGQPVDRLKIAIFDTFDDMRHLYSINGVVFILVRPVDLIEGPEHYAVKQGWIMESNTYKSNDSATYKNAYNYTINGLQTMLDAQRSFNSAVGNQ